MITMFVVLAAPTAYIVGVGYWIRALVRGWWRRPGWLAGTAALLIPPAGITYFFGAAAGALDEAEACRLASGYDLGNYDAEYAAAHRSYSFPLRHPCNAELDLVAGWVNPTLAVLTLAVGGLLVAALVVAIRRRTHARGVEGMR
jgi:hypothetical protein